MDLVELAADYRSSVGKAWLPRRAGKLPKPQGRRTDTVDIERRAKLQADAEARKPLLERKNFWDTPPPPPAPHTILRHAGVPDRVATKPSFQQWTARQAALKKPKPNRPVNWLDEPAPAERSLPKNWLD